jgi:hypothetical protein
MNQKDLLTGKDFTSTAMQFLRHNDFINLAELFIEKDRSNPGNGNLYELMDSLRYRYNEICENSCDFKIMNKIIQAEQMIAEYLGEKERYLYALFEEIINCCCQGDQRYKEVEIKLRDALFEMNMNHIKARIALSFSKLHMSDAERSERIMDVHKAIQLADQTIDCDLKRQLHAVKDKLLTEKKGELI